MFRINFDNPIVHQDMVDIDAMLPKENKELFGKSVYISGASGMIASYLVAYLIWLNEVHNAQITIYAGIRNTERGRQRFGEYIDREWFHVISGDVASPSSFQEQNFKDLKPDYIIHAASLASPQYYGSFPVETMLPNVIGTWLLLEHCRKFPVKGFLFFSSGSVYGSVKDSALTSIKEDDFGTLDFLAKGNVYGESKRCGETLSRAYFNEYSVPIRIARIHHTYGPTVDIDNDTRVFSEFVSNIINRQDIVLKSSGTGKRAFCYITDTLAGLIKILITGTSGEVYNVGNPDEYVSIQELAQVLVRIFSDRKLKVIQCERETIGYSASPDRSKMSVNVQKLKGIGWENKVSIKDGFFRTVSAIDFNLREAL